MNVIKEVMEEANDGKIIISLGFYAKLVVTPYFPQHPQLSYRNGIIVKIQGSNKRPRVPKHKPKAEAKVTVTAEEKVVSLYFRKNNQGEGGLTIISSSNKMKKQVKAQNKKRVVFPYCPHENNDIVVVSKARAKVSLTIAGPKSIYCQETRRRKRIKNKIRASMKYTRKNEKKKSVSDAYMRKTKDNAWIPPRSVYALLQEKYFEDPWKVLIICILLNKTTGNQARKVIQDLLELSPNADAATMVEIEEIEKVICSLGLQKKCSEMSQQFSEDYISDETHADDLPEIGKYAANAYAIFCTGHWKDVVLDDCKLNPY